MAKGFTYNPTIYIPHIGQRYTYNPTIYIPHIGQRYTVYLYYNWFSLICQEVLLYYAHRKDFDTMSTHMSFRDSLDRCLKDLKFKAE